MAGYTFEYNKIGLHCIESDEYFYQFHTFRTLLFVGFPNTHQCEVRQVENTRADGIIHFSEQPRGSRCNEKSQTIVCKSCFQCFMPTIYITLCTLGWFGEYIFYCCEICLLLQLIPFYLNLFAVQYPFK